MSRKYRIQNITDALISSGYTSLDDQAKALGLHRATAWTIIKSKHKLGRLSAKTIEKMIMNPATPPRVLAAVEEYVAEIELRRSSPPASAHWVCSGGEGSGRLPPDQRS